MPVTALGGAGEVGASSYLLEHSGARILIDGGIRTSSAGRKQPLPRFDLLDGKSIDAVLLTHAHADHTGALPMLVDRLQDAPIHMSIGTLHLLEVMLLDAVRRMETEELEGSSSGISYTIEDMERMISLVVPHRYYEWFYPVPGRSDVRVQFIPCGHILGAGMMVIDLPGLRYLWTGDYSVNPQPTVGGVDLSKLRDLAADRPFDVMITEGTYGDAVHPPREREEERLIQVLEKATRKGGRVLIPAFAVGRSQDLTYLIRNAKLQGRLNGVSVYLDGLVRGVTSIYQNVLHDLYPGFEEPIQLLDAELGIYRANSQSRAKLLVGENDGPAIVIASSGMLTGGKSLEYAKAFAPGRSNAILLTGYSDEESPARKIQGLKPGAKLPLSEDEWVRVRCFVGKYQLSAHADSAQVLSVIEAAQPRRIGLVHGDLGSLKALSRLIGYRKAKVLKNGEEFKVAENRKKWVPVDLPSDDFYIRAGQEALGGKLGPEKSLPNSVAIRHLWSILVDGGGRSYSESEMCRMLLGHAYSPADREALAQVLADHRVYFLTGSATGQRSYRPRPTEEVRDLLIEQSSAFQIPVERGDIVTLCDGSTDLFLAVADEVGSSEITGVIVPQSSRRTFKREWVRSVALPSIAAQAVSAEAPDVRKMLTGHRGFLVRWLEDLIRDARALPGVNPVQIYYQALAMESQSVSLDQALAVCFPERKEYSLVERVAVAIALSDEMKLFSLQPDGSFLARNMGEVKVRWDAFSALDYVRSLEPGSGVTLNSGQTVYPTGEWSPQSFEARTEDGTIIRCNYRRVVVP